MALAPRELIRARRHARSLFGAIAACACLLAAARAHAADPFEIQVYDGTANDPRQFGLELHLNTVASGLRDGPPPLLPPHHQTHATLEPSIGMTPWWELGGYLQSTLRGDGHFDYSGIKLRSKFVTPPGWHSHVRLGVNLEVSMLPSTYDPDRLGSEIRPIAAWEDEGWLFAFNPIVELPFGGQGPGFAPAIMAVRKIGSVVSVGVEYYADLGPFAHIEAPRDQQHYLYEVVNLLAIDSLELNVGLGEGLTPASNGVVFKTIVGYGF
jgi:hypothetical protein